MRYLSKIAASCIFVLPVIAFASFCRGEPDQDGNQGEQVIIGPWRADSVMLLLDKSKQSASLKKSLRINEQQPFSIVISERNLTMRVGKQKFAEMPYTSDSKHTPCTIDVKFQDHDMFGIYELRGDNLKISLNDVKKGRPMDFDADMDLVLHRFQGRPIMIINADGTDPRRLTSLPEHDCDSPRWSPDGEKISFDCWHSLFGDDWTKSHICVADSNGSSPVDLGDGTLSSWSPDGKRIAYSRYSPNDGIWVMNADGTDKKLIDAEGWSAAWSPKSDELAYLVGSNICIYDLKSRARRNLLDKRYRGVYWGLAWSPDGRWICFQGTLPDGRSELALVDAQGQAKGFSVLLPGKDMEGVKGFQTGFSSSPEGKQIALSMIMEGDLKTQIYILDVEGKKPPQRLDGQNQNAKNYAPAWSPDGKIIAFALQK